MKKLHIHIIVGLLLAGSISFFALTVVELNNRSAAEEYRGQFRQAVHEAVPFSFNEVMEGLTPVHEPGSPLQTADYVALMLLNPGVCTACILETHELIEHFASYEEKTVQPVVVVLSGDEQSALQFLQTSQFRVPSYWGRHPQLSHLTQMTGNTPPAEQLLAVADPAGNRVFYRNIIPTRITSVAYKQSLLEEVFSNF
ncbi:MAG: hypothetical protein ACNA8K_17010 [Cyclonatronaceae bacterium]